jgi:nucleoside-diphosphate-sugar epimerase
VLAAAAGVEVPRTSAIPPWVLRASGVVSREMRELAETSYMFTEPFVMDSTASEEERLGLSPTPLADGLATTVAWWRAQGRAAA